MRQVAFSPYLLAVVLTPVFLQTSTPLSCTSGDTTLSEFALIVEGEDQIVGFDPNQQSYGLSLPTGTDEALVHTVSTDPEARVWVDVLIDGERLRYQHGGLGGGDLVVPLPKGASTLEVWVRPPGGATDYYDVAIQVGLPCTEDALRKAVADGGGPHEFDCDEPIVTASTIYIYRDVKLDGLGTLVVSGGDDHRVFWVDYATVEFRAMTITEGSATGQGQGTALFNYGGDVTIVDSTLSDNYRGAIGNNSAKLTIENSVITRNTDAYGGGGIALYASSLTISDSIVSDNTSEWYGGIGVVEPDSRATLIRTLVTRNVATVYGNGGLGAGPGCEATIIDSTISDNRAARNGGGIGGGGIDTKLSVIGSTIVGNVAGDSSGGVGVDTGTLIVTNSTVSGNHAEGRAGGIAIGASGTGIVTNTTVTDNTAQIGSAIGTLGAITVANSIVVGDCGFLGPSPVFTNTVEGIPTGAPFESTCFGSIVIQDTDVGLGPLQDNGGLTETHALLPSSVAIDSVPVAMCEEATDQRGVSRPQGTACDAGAYEVQP
jgi:parallel beta-helix repeat protein